MGHDYRSYSEEIKVALKEGVNFYRMLCRRHRFVFVTNSLFCSISILNTDAVAMVTASHNENGWTGVKMGIEKGLTHAPKEMNRIKDISFK